MPETTFQTELQQSDGDAIAELIRGGRGLAVDNLQAAGATVPDRLLKAAGRAAPANAPVTAPTTPPAAQEAPPAPTPPATPKPAAEPSRAQDAPSQPAPADKPDGDILSEKDWQEAQMPDRNKANFSKFRESHFREVKSLSEKLATVRAEADAAKKAAEEAAKAPPRLETPPEVQELIAAKDAEIAKLHQAFIESDVARDPQFKSHYDGKAQEAVERAKRAVGPELAEKVASILSLKDKAVRDERLDALYEEIPNPRISGRLTNAVDALDAVEAEREAELARSATIAQERQAQRRVKAEAAQKALAQTWKETVTEAKTLPLFAAKPDNAEHNQAVDSDIAKAEAVLKGNDVKALIRTALLGIALPRVTAQADAEMRVKDATITAKDAEIAALKKQIAQLSNAEPGGGLPAPADAAGDDFAPKIRAGMSLEDEQREVIASTIRAGKSGTIPRMR